MSITESIFFCFVITSLCFCIQTNNPIFKSRVETVSLRLHPYQDIMSSLTKALSSDSFKALSIASAVGSVRSCWLRFANNSDLSYLQGPFEITSLTGTFDKNLKPHLHIQLCDGSGKSIGGHLPSLSERKIKFSVNNNDINIEGQDTEFGCPIFTTLQIAMLHHTDIVYERKTDQQTTFDQLYILQKNIKS